MNNPYDIYKLLDKSNCRQCHLASCMAFAVAVIQGQKKIQDCPRLSKDIIDSISESIQPRKTLEDDQQNVLASLKAKIAEIDLQVAARRLGVGFSNGKIAVNCLGKDFLVDFRGEMSSECHTNHWVLIPLLHYILNGKGTPPKNEWLTFGDLKHATKAWAQYFSHRCEASLLQLADAHTDLLFEILSLFGAQQRKGITNAEHCLVIEPFPNVLFMINYWPPEDDFDSQLTLLFDSAATDNLDLDSIYLVCRGLVEMFRELIVKHSKDGKLF